MTHSRAEMAAPLDLSDGLGGRRDRRATDAPPRPAPAFIDSLIHPQTVGELPICAVRGASSEACVSFDHLCFFASF